MSFVVQGLTQRLSFLISSCETEARSDWLCQKEDRTLLLRAHLYNLFQYHEIWHAAEEIWQATCICIWKEKKKETNLGKLKCQPKDCDYTVVITLKVGTSSAGIAKSPQVIPIPSIWEKDWCFGPGRSADAEAVMSRYCTVCQCMRLYCSSIFFSFCFKLAKDTTETLREAVNKLRHHSASVWLKMNMLPSIIVKTHPKPLRLCPPLVNHCWGLPWVTVLILSSPSCWRTSRGFHHPFQAAACSKHLWTTSPLPQTLAVPLWSYSYASPWASHQGDLFMHACMCVSACGWGSCRSGIGLLGWLGKASYWGIRTAYVYISICSYIYP